jgi:predicted RNA-binding protein with PUA-like domain
MKSEPDTFSIDDLQRQGRTPWEGVRNYQARNFMRDDMKVGDAVLFYHSNATPPGVVGLARVASAPYPDAAAFDPTSPYFDPRSDAATPRWILVDVAFVEKWTAPVPLDRLRDDPALHGMLVTQKGQRLSVQPVDRAHFVHVARLGGSAQADALLAAKP